MTRSGEQYLKGLGDARRVVLAGSRVDDVVVNPHLSAPAQSIARLYDRQLDNTSGDLLIDDGQDIYATAFLQPRTADDLALRGRAFREQAATTFGLMGRSPDFIASAITAFAASAEFFEQADPRFADNVRTYYDYCRGNDLFLAHAAINPSADRSKSSGEGPNANIHLRVVDRTRDGITVNGVKLISTLVPIADELVVFTMPGYRDQDTDYAVSFAIPVDTPGLTLACREPFGGLAARDPHDHPLARYDEMDATCIFDNVFVPTERVFMDGNTALANTLYDTTGARHLTGHHGVTRGLEKAKLLVGIAITLAESSGGNKFLHVQEMLGELISMLDIVEGAVARAVTTATTSSYGILLPDIRTIQSLRYHFPKMVQRMLEVIQILGSGSLLATPANADLNSETMGDHLAATFASAANGDPRDRIALLKLAWDISGDGFGARQMQYERYANGDPVRIAAQQYLKDGLDPLRELAITASAGAIVE